MATAAFIPSGAITIPNGGSVDVEVVWTLNQGTPSENGYLRLVLNGATLVDAPITVQGQPGETEPAIVLASPTQGQALLHSDVATITPLGNRRFRLS